MGLFFKKDISYANGKKPMISIIKNEGRPDEILWRVPYEDFNVGSRVIVAENEEALFWKNGEVLATFTGGSYELSGDNSTDNHMWMNKIKTVSTGGVSAFNCKIIYLNKTHILNNLWGTDSPIQVIDNVYKIKTSLAARGSYSFQIDDGKKFFLKFVGSNASVMNSVEIVSSLRAPIMQNIKSSLSNFISQMNMEIIGISMYLDKLAEAMMPILSKSFEEYGIRLVNFYIESLDVVDDDSRLKLEDARTRRAVMGIDAEAESEYIRKFGISWGKYQTSEILKMSALNQNGVAGDGAGIGMGLASMGAMLSNASSLMTPLDDPRVQSFDKDDASNHEMFAPVPKDSLVKEIECSSCGSTIDATARFCSNCGAMVGTICSNCGAKADSGFKFCSNCGGKL